jgi:diacylglycerol O-acyltransferase
VPVPIDPTSVGFLIAENRAVPMHVGGLQLFKKPEGAPRDYARKIYQQMLDVDEIAPIFLKRPVRSLRTAGQWCWTPDLEFDLEHHVRHSALPKPGRVRELLELCSRLHGTRLARERPLWEAHMIEGMRDGRIAMYWKLHHSLVDGVSAMRLLQSSLSTDPAEMNMSAPWAAKPSAARAGKDQQAAEHSLSDIPIEAMRTALGITAEAAGMPAALIRTLTKGIRNETSALSLHAPRTMFNTTITGSRRFAAQGWPLERLKGISKASGTTLNDVVLAMCSGAVRAYLLEHDALPDSTLISMVPVSLASKTTTPMAPGGNAVGAVMVKLGTDLADPGSRLEQISQSMDDGKESLSSMTPVQIMAMSVLGMAPSIIAPLLKLHGIVRPPFNLIISNVPGPREPLYLNGAKLVGTYPLSIPIQGMALNITCNSYDQDMEFGLIGCRRSVPHLQRLLTHLDNEVAALEKATGAA